MVPGRFHSGQCAHAPLNETERNKPWLKKDSATHNALAKIVLDKRFLNSIPYFINLKSCTIAYCILYSNCIPFHSNDIQYFFHCFSSHEIHRLYRQFLYSRETLHKYFVFLGLDGNVNLERTQQWCAVKVLKRKTYWLHTRPYKKSI